MNTFSKKLQTTINNDPLNSVLQSIFTAGKKISLLLEKTTCQPSTTQNTTNSSGEQQKPLDILANEILKKELSQCAKIYAISSEEEDNAVLINTNGEYLISFDPLDGSSNIEVNIATGTIFSILKKQTNTEPLDQQFLQKGKQQIAAGFILYGSATTAYIALQQTSQQQSNVHQIELINNRWEIIKEHCQIPQNSNEIAVNIGNFPYWSVQYQQFINQYLKAEKGDSQQKISFRYVGSMVADLYRILHRGGIFLYPYQKNTTDNSKKEGKLRLLYEANPMSMIIQQAGGIATDGEQPLLEIQPNTIHQKIGVILGSENLVNVLQNLK